MEVDVNGNEVWKYINPVSARGILAQGDSHFGDVGPDNRVFRCTKYPVDFSGFVGKLLEPGAPIELNPSPVCFITDISSEVSQKIEIRLFPNPVSVTEAFRIVPGSAETYSVRVFDNLGRLFMEKRECSGETELVIPPSAQGLLNIVIPEFDYSHKLVVR